MGYLGKIAAVVSVNTGDFSSKLNRAADDVENFASATRRSIGSAARSTGTAFGSIYTDVQKLERALQAASKLQFTGLKAFPGKSLQEAADNLRQMSSVAMQISAPLAAAAKQSESLAMSIREGIHPALKAAQALAEEMQTSMTGGASVSKKKFEELEAIVRKTGQAMDRVSKASSMAGSLTGGKDLRSQSPQTHAALERSQLAQQSVYSLPAGAISSTPSLLAKQRAAADAVARSQAQVDSGRAMGKSTGGAERALDANIAKLNMVNDLIEKEVALHNAVTAALGREEAAAAASAAAMITAAVESEARVWALRDAEQKSFGERQASIAKSIHNEEQMAIAAEKRAREEEQAINRVKAARLTAMQQTRANLSTGQIQNVEQLTAAYDKLLSRLRALPSSDRAKALASPVTQSAMGYVEKTMSNGDQAGVAASASALAYVESAVLKTENDIKTAKEKQAAADERAAEAAARAKSSAETLLRLEQSRLQAMTGQSQSVSQLASQYGSVLSRLDQLSAKQKAVAGAAVAANAGMVEYAISSGTDADVSAFKGEIAALEAAAAQGAAADAADQKAAAQAKSSAETLLRLEQSRLQVMTGQSHSVSQLNSEYGSILSRLGQLSAKQKAVAGAVVSAHAGAVQQAISSGSDAAAAAAAPDVAAMAAALAASEKLDANEKDATKSAQSLKDALSRIAGSIGEPAQPIDRLKKSVDEANAAIDKMAAGADKAKANAAMLGVKGKIPLATSDADIDALTKRAGQISGFAGAHPAKETPDALFGPDFGTAARGIDDMRAKTKSLHSDFAKLPEPLQKQLGGVITKLRGDVANLTPKSTAAEIAKVAKEYRAAADMVERFNNAASVKVSFAKYLNTSAFSYFSAQQKSIQSQMAAIGAEAGGPIAAAVDKYSLAFVNASKKGSLGTAAVRTQMKGLVKDIGDAAVAEGKYTKAQAQQFVGGVMKTGDISRGGLDRFGPAINQAAYAVDDFMSATGGAEQKIRAISNNITQLGFVIGKTRGLLIALAAVIGAQASLAIYRFVTGGKTAEDTTKALNDALSKQQSKVTELASAYRELAKSMPSSSAAKKGVENSAVLAGLGVGNHENQMSRMTGVNSGVVNERASSASIKRAMESSGITTSAGALIYRNELLKQSKTKEKLAEAEARRAPAGNIQDLEEMRRKRSAITFQMRNSTAATGLESMGIDPRWNRGFSALSVELEALEAVIRATEGTIEHFADTVSMASVASAQVAALRIEAAGALMASAIEAGVPGAMNFQHQLDSISSEMSSALNDLASASEQTGERKGLETIAAQASVQAAFDKTADIISKTLEYRIKAALSAGGASDVLGKMGGSGRFASARGSYVGVAARKEVADAQLGVRNTQVSAATSESNRIRAEGRKRVADAEQDLMEADRGVYGTKMDKRGNPVPDEEAKKKVEDAIAAARAEVEAQKVSAGAANQAADANLATAIAARDKAQADKEAADAADKLAGAMGRAALDVEQFLGRTRKIGEGAVTSAEKAADIRQEMFQRRPSIENVDQRDFAEERLIGIRRDAEQAQITLDAKRDELLKNDPDVQRHSQDISDYENDLVSLQERQANGENVRDDIMDARWLVANSKYHRDVAMFRGTAEERQAQEEIAREADKFLEQAESAQRAKAAQATERDRIRQGREDAMTERERRKLDFTRSAENMAAAAGEFANPKDRQDFVQKYYDNKKKEILQAGPLGQAADERFNAQFTTRRLGLDATDVTTMEGSKELNRLLRGDDANKDVNFAEMQKQSEILADIRDAVQNNTGLPVIP